ncbi:MAG: transposase [Eggerthellaceae bacterium]|nr:transposase [Eggerthellaceae bacterium]
MGRHDIQTRERAVELMERGLGAIALARELAISSSITEKWIHSYKAVGREVFLSMGSKHMAYDYETKLSAVRAFLEDGLTRQEVMSKHAITSPTSLDRWVKAYRDGGPEALEPKPKGRPRSKCADRPAMTREQELEEENRRLRAEVAYLKKLRSLEAAKREPGRNAR